MDLLEHVGHRRYVDPQVFLGSRDTGDPGTPTLGPGKTLRFKNPWGPEIFECLMAWRIWEAQGSVDPWVPVDLWGPMDPWGGFWH
jgi:hypothetical protein